MRLDWQTTILAPLLASEPNHQVLNFAAECIEVLHSAFAAGKAYPKSQVLEAEAAASCQAGGPRIMRELRRKFTLVLAPTLALAPTPTNPKKSAAGKPFFLFTA